MLHYFKSCGLYLAIDSRDGSVYLPDELTFNMLHEISDLTNLPKEFPMGMRYAFAKYDSQDLKKAYSFIYDIVTPEKEEYSPVQFNTYYFDVDSPIDVMKSLPEGAKVYIESDASAVLTAKYPKLDFTFISNKPCNTPDCGNIVKYDILPSSACANETVLFYFNSAEDLISSVKKLFEAGITKIAGYPSSDVSESAAAEAYEKLCRELARMKKKGTAPDFVPFMFDKSVDGFAKVTSEGIKAMKGGDFSDVYTRRGSLAVNAIFLSSDALIDKCAECAVVLSVK